MVERVRPKESVGYKQPPLHSRFKEGKSGNPRGRRKGSFSLRERMRRAALAQVTVTENGKRKKISKLDAAIQQQVNKAASGDGQAFKLLAQLFGESDGESRPNAQPFQVFLTADESKY